MTALKVNTKKYEFKKLENPVIHLPVTISSIGIPDVRMITREAVHALITSWNPFTDMKIKRTTPTITPIRLIITILSILFSSL